MIGVVAISALAWGPSITRLARRLATITAIVALAILALAPQAAVAQVRLTFPAAGLPGLHASRVSQRTARNDLASRLSPRLAAFVGGAQAQVAAARGTGLDLRSDAFVFGSTRTARSVITAWRRLRHPRSVPVGDGGYVTAGGSHAVVAWRDGARIGVIDLTTAAKKDPGSRALGYALLADSWLRTPLPSTAWAKVLEQIRPDGTVSKRTALEAFATIYGPLPGVPAPEGSRTVAQSGTPAAQWVLSYWRALTHTQQKAIARRLGIAMPGSSALAADYGDPGFHQDPSIQALAEKFVGIYQPRLGHTLGVKVVAGTTSTVVNAYADTLGVNAEGQPVTPVVTCRIRVPPAGQEVEKKQGTQFVPPLELVIAHEVFHCFQGDITGWNSLPAWITEGSADWAALTVDPVSFFHGGGNLNNYIQTPHTELFKRSYDAVGFWGHAEDVVPNLWAAMPAILNSGSSQAAFALANGNTDAFLTTWGSSVFRLMARPALGDAQPDRTARADRTGSQPR